MKIYFLLLLFCCSLTALASQDDCYKILRQEGMTFLGKTNYRNAVDKFFAARYCPDKPEKDDLDELIKTTLNQWVRALNKARQRAETAEQEARALSAQADTLRYYLRGDSTYANFIRSGKINFENGAYQEALYDFTIARFVQEKEEVKDWITTTQQAMQAEEWAVAGNLDDAFEAFQTLDSLDASDYRSERMEQLQLTQKKWKSALNGRVLQNLDTLDLAGKGDVLALYVLPNDIAKAKKLKVLDVRSNELLELSPMIGKLTQLHTIKAGQNQILRLPSTIGQLVELRYLDLSDNDLETLPSEIGKLLKLEHLYLAQNELYKLPTDLGRLLQLKTLDLRGNDLSKLSHQDWLFLKKLKSLRMLFIEQNELSAEVVAHIRTLVPGKCGVVSD